MAASIDSGIRVEYGKMSGKRVKFTNAHAWRDAAMRRSSDINVAESNQRRAAADAYNQEQGISTPDMLADQQLYIQGKMGLEEYQEYLLFKHSSVATRK